MKYLLGMLSALASLLLGATVFADNYDLQVLNLPLVQTPNQTFTFTMSLTSSFSGAEQKATLYVDDCGKDLTLGYQSRARSSVPLTLSPDGKQEFPLTLYRDSNDECVLTFKLVDENQTLLTSTKVGILPQCPFERARKPIDEGLNYTLPEILAQNAAQPSPSSQPAPAAPSAPKASPSSTRFPPTFNPSIAPLVQYTNIELQSAFDLLVEKGILTAEDKEKLQQPLTRIEAAKLFVDIAVMNDLPRDEKSCTFPDLANASEEEITIAKLACQFNIMGVNPDYTQLENFMPSLIIPSEQLVTAFSRLMWRDLYEQPENAEYYELHMNTMYNGGLVDEKVTNSPQKWADFVIIAARAIEKQQLTLAEPKPTEPVKEEKSRSRFR